MPPKEILLSDYKVPDFLIRSVDLDIDILADHARAHIKFKVRRNPKAKSKNEPLFLDGEAQKLVGVFLDKRKLDKKEYAFTPHGLTIPKMPDRALVEVISTHNPYTNTTLSGFYASGSMLSTQCEPEGFRRIAYYPDRPDVMAKFRVTIRADKKKYPVLLSNGNLIAAGNEKQKGRHYAIWEDPFPKPSYLFAMVAGKLDKRASSYRTRQGRKVRIEIYVEPGKLSETDFALAALKKAMRWDEERFNLEYDLDRFMIVATPYFNMGAMENKGLNIFNDACALGRTDTATDATISFIERCVAHEYFHNWTGDRITLRNWFQLSLKEGLTIFREQEYMGDAHCIPVERLDNVRDLRRRQFSEDAGAMAHSVRPDRYAAIDNFYTCTVYDKGGEIARMIQTLVGVKGFNKGMALYVRRHDGQAVTCEDFVKAMSSANKIDLKQFMRWYKQAGTPVLDVESRYDADAKELTLSVRQSCRPTPGQPHKKPLHIPFAIGLLSRRGKDLVGTRVLSLKKPLETYTFSNIKQKPVLSLLRNFSAPVRLNYAYTEAELLFLLAHDSDPFSRWEAGFKLATQLLLDPSPESENAFIAALGEALRDPCLDADFKAMVLTLPTEAELGLAQKTKGRFIDPDALYEARSQLIKRIAIQLKKDFEKEHKRLSRLVKDTAADGATMGRRSLKNLCLSYLARVGDQKILKTVFTQATKSANMTDTIAALGILADSRLGAAAPLRKKALAAFEKKWKSTPTLMDKWFAVQASARQKDVLKTVRALMRHRTFTIKNPNRISALIGSFAANGLGFHSETGAGYRFIADMILKIDSVNPLSAASIAKNFARWLDYTPKRRQLMHVQLKRINAHKKLSRNTSEVVSKSLKG